MSPDAFLELVRDEVGLELAEPDLDTAFDDLEGWDSVMMLKLLGAVEQATGRPAPMMAFLEATSLRGVHAVIGP
ncbi:acyl carrier protein [Prauserella sp. PE36]|uniref:Acyl carrier protein n=1 Tax=Prauserella endophytica TaxID=1592324 RepID=A0ABY2RU07_9PSEU|nr:MULTISPECIES: acyl carrier protein [Prauserella]PXY23748.1 hypothetical protein BAY59_29380 [Prauserella coralliicola]RBM16789.1 acyl carrier protein [Prauserella sp. PE36]TKG60510.1 acyl carrier protein [Prauserella endophytica]